MQDNPYEPPTIPSEPSPPRPKSWQFVERRIVGNQEEVVLRHLAIYSWMRLPVLGLMIWAIVSPGVAVAFPIAIVAAVVFVLSGLPYWSIGREVKQRMLVQPVTIQGSRYSFSNPMTYRWDTNL